MTERVLTDAEIANALDKVERGPVIPGETFAYTFARRIEALTIERINQTTKPPAPEFLQWLADRFVHVHHVSENMDFVQAIRRLGERLTLGKHEGAICTICQRKGCEGRHSEGADEGQRHRGNRTHYVGDDCPVEGAESACPCGCHHQAARWCTGCWERHEGAKAIDYCSGCDIGGEERGPWHATNCRQYRPLGAGDGMGGGGVGAPDESARLLQGEQGDCRGPAEDACSRRAGPTGKPDRGTPARHPSDSLAQDDEYCVHSFTAPDCLSCCKRNFEAAIKQRDEARQLYEGVYDALTDGGYVPLPEPPWRPR